MQGGHQLLLLVARGGVDGDREQGLGQQPGLDQRRAALAGQGVRGLGGGQLGDQHQITGDRAGLRAGLVSERRRERSGPLVITVVLRMPVEMMRGKARQVTRDVQRRVGTQRAGEHPDQREPADERVADGADHLGDQRTGGIAGDRAEVPARCGLDRRQAGRVRGGEAVFEQVVQLLDAHPGRGVGGDHRKEPGGGDGRAQIGGHGLELDLLPVQVPLQQHLVLGLLDDRLHQRATAVLDQGRLLLVRRAHNGRAVAVVGDGPAQQVDQPGDAAVGEQRDVDRLGIAEHPPAARDGLVEVAAGLFQLGHRNGPGHPGHLALPPQQPGGLVDVPTGRHHEQHRVGGAQPGAYLADEVRMARGVDEVDVDLAARDRGRLQRGGSSRLPAHVPARRTRGDEPLEQRALARRGGPDEDDVADLLRSGRADRPRPVGFIAHCSTFSAQCGEGKTCSIISDPIQK